MHAPRLFRLGLATLSLSCQPTVELGSNGDTAAGTTSGDEASTMSSTAPVTDATSTPPDTTSTVGPQDETSTGAVVADSGDSSSSGSADAAAEGSSSTGQTQSCTDFFPVEVPCLQCAELQCCDEIDLCLGQPECDCFLNCLQSATAEQCQMMCEPASGAAAVATCLALACVVACP